MTSDLVRHESIYNIGHVIPPQQKAKFPVIEG